MRSKPVGAPFPDSFTPMPLEKTEGISLLSALLWVNFSPSEGGLSPASPAPLRRARHQWQSNPGHLAAGEPRHDAPLLFHAAD